MSWVATRGAHHRGDVHLTLILAAVDAVTASGLVKRFEATTAVDGLDLIVAPGQVHGLLGANGAGKTTLLRLLFGLIAPDAGSIQLLGRPLGGPGSAALDHVAGFVEEPSFYPYLSGKTNLALLAKLDGEAPPALIDEVLERVGLAERAASRVGGYSTGMRQRLGIAAALLRTPRLLLLDEPTSGLDPGGARAVATLMRELADQGRRGAPLKPSDRGAREGVRCLHGHPGGPGRVARRRGRAGVAQAPASAYALATSDDERALQIAGAIRGVRAGRSPRGQLAIAVQAGSLDALVLALGDARVAVRRLELLVSPLESMFFALSAG